MEKLNDKQRAFAEQHHGLIYSFLNQNGLDENDFYDIAAIGYLKSIKKYFDEEKLQQYAFSTIAYRTMKREVHNHFSYMSRKKRKADVISLDRAYYDYDASFLESLGTDDQSFEERMLDIEIASLLSSGQFNLVKLVMNGWTRKQLKEKTSCSQEELAEQLTAVRFRLAGMIDRTQKQKIYFEGCLARPLRIGYRAYLLNGDKISVTPMVTNILAEDENTAVFETAGSIYEVAPWAPAHMSLSES